MTPWAVACQAPLSMGFSRQEYWSGLPCPSPGDLPNPGIKLRSPALQADSLLSKPLGKPIRKYAALRTWDLVGLGAGPCTSEGPQGWLLAVGFALEYMLADRFFTTAPPGKAPNHNGRDFF